MTAQPGELRWGNGALTVHLGWEEDGPVRLLDLLLTGDTPRQSHRPARPLVELECTGTGRTGTSGKRHVDGDAAARQRYLGHEERTDGDWRELIVSTADPAGGLRVTAHLRLHAQLPVLRSWAEVTAGQNAVTVEYLSSFVFAGLAGRVRGRWEDGLRLHTAANPWSGEFRWSDHTLAERGLYDVGMVRYGQTGSKNRVALTSTGAWSSAEHLPMGCVEDPASGRALLWQIEHNGAWHAEVGDYDDDVYLALSGPTDREHAWRARLQPGQSFTGVPVAVALSPDGFQGAVGAMTAYRRALVRPHPDHERLPVVFNDFNNCLMSDPSTAAVLPLVEAAAAAGAEYYVIDAGWYADTDGWWDAVGEWEESAVRFPGGLKEVTDRIRALGMLPGLWLEPEVVGVRSPLAKTLPEEAFFQRDGERVVQWGRYQLDLRHPAARTHLDAVVDRLVTDYGLGYLKLDYNIDIGTGTGDAPGAGLLGHNRALLDWLDAVLDRHPGLVVESCAAGGSRSDYATLARFPIHSLTDQQDHHNLPPIAVAAPAAVLPEQGAMWAYPQAEFDTDAIGLALVPALLGRIHLSGRIDRLDPVRLELVRTALDVYKGYRACLGTAVPRWPLGLPGWRAPWTALALHCTDAIRVSVFRRETDTDRCALPFPELRGRAMEVEPLFDAAGDATASWDLSAGELTVTLPRSQSALLLRLIPAP
ncbi:glycoside hydrolase family 36 protein [Streptacidiphilus sp. EB103A]|uniref:glycoside hydrolase family 36 protein n=1 Tax=Streptacidiphilus sp. EB103A TaxID=3156275 RepID=UPI0035168782